MYICSLSTDHAENIASSSSSIVARTLCLAMALVLMHAYEAVAYQRVCLHSGSLATAVSSGLTVLTLSKYVAIWY
jgi:hypothetical protein